MIDTENWLENMIADDELGLLNVKKRNSKTDGSPVTWWEKEAYNNNKK